MSDTGLKFGPEWMRALSHGGGGGNITGPGHPSGLVPIKGKPAPPEHRYTREKMLQLCNYSEAPPEGLLEDPAAICGDPECVVPLAYTALTQEEQRMWHRNINSESATRFVGITGGRGGGGGGGGGGAMVGGGMVSQAGGMPRGRGGSMDRGRGRSRGLNNSYYSRTISSEEDVESNRGVLRDMAPPGITMRRNGGGGVGPYERSTSLSSGLGSLSSSGGIIVDGRGAPLGAWGVPPNLSNAAADSSNVQMGGYHVSQSSMDHSNPLRGSSVQGEERMGGASSPRKEQGRASTENWRSRDLSVGGGGGVAESSGPTTMQEQWRSGAGSGLSAIMGSNRSAPDKWGTSRGTNGWRPRVDSLDDNLYGNGNYNGGGRGRGLNQSHQRTRQPWDNSSRRNWADDDRLPEWATDLSQERGSFDASGAFHSPAWNSDGGDGTSFLTMATSGSNISLNSSRARHKSGSVGAGDTTSNGATNATTALESEAANAIEGRGAQRGDKGRTPSDDNINSTDNNNIRRPPCSDVPSSGGHASESQKRLSEALELNTGVQLCQSGGLVNGYGRDTNSSHEGSPHNSHEGSPLVMDGRGVTSRSVLQGTTSRGGHNGPSHRGALSRAYSMSQVPSDTDEAAAFMVAGNNNRISHINGSLVGSVPTSSTHVLNSSGVPKTLDDPLINSMNNPINEFRRQLPNHGQLMQAAGKDDHDRYREEDLEHMQIVADDLVSKLVDEEPKRSINSRLQQPELQPSLHNPGPPAGFLPRPELTQPSNENINSWYYTDPQQKVQGPFTAENMASWYSCGYFAESLLLRRDCDDKFAKLGDLIKVFGRVPFLPGREVAPLKGLSPAPMSQEAQEAAEKERQIAEYEQAAQTYILQKQLYDQQIAFRQRSVFRNLSSLENWNSIPDVAQRQLFVQQMLAYHPPLQEPVPPVRPNLLLSNTTATEGGISLPSLLSLQEQPKTSHHSTPPSGDVAQHIQQQLQQARLQIQHPPVHDAISARDPIQDLVAQMSSVNTSTKNSAPLSSNLSLQEPVNLMSKPCTSTSLPIAGDQQNILNTVNAVPEENPLKKLLMQLQRGASNNSSNDSPSINSQQPSQIPPPTFTTQHLPTAPVPATTEASAALLHQQSAPHLPTKLDNNQLHDEDVIQTFMQQLNKMHQKDQTVAAQPTVDHLQQLPEDNDRRQLQQRQQQEQQRKSDEENRKAEALRLKKEEESIARKKIEDRNKQLEEEIKKKEDQKRREHEEELRKKAVEAKRKDDEKKNKHRQRQQEEANRKQEEKRRQQEDDNKRRAEEKRRDHEAREVERKQQEEARRISLEEERKRMQRIEQEELELQAAQQQESTRLLQQQQQAAWGAAATTHKVDNKNGQNPTSLIEIQKIQQEKERLERERWLKDEEARKQDVIREAAEKKKTAPMTLKWAVKQGGSSSTSSIKSLVQIQAEEEKERKKRQTREQQEMKAAAAAAAATAAVSSSGPVSHAPTPASGGARVWGAAGSQPLSWANRASTFSAAPPPAAAQHSTSLWSENYSWSSQQQPQNSGGGFWESGNDSKSGVKTAASVAASRTPTKPKPVLPTKQRSTSALKQTSTSKLNAQVNHNNKTASKKKGKEEEIVKKIFTDTGSVDDFSTWCKKALVSLKVDVSVDVPTFVNFLGDVESPYEVHDYIRSYLGDTREVKDFAKTYLEKRSQVLNATRQKNVEHDDILAPAPAINPASETFQGAKNRKQKGKKKMQKVDSSILGFNVNNKDRVNNGGEDHGSH